MDGLSSLKYQKHNEISKKLIILRTMHIAAFEAKGNRNFLITLKDRKGREWIIRLAKEIMGIF